LQRFAPVKIIKKLPPFEKKEKMKANREKLRLKVRFYADENLTFLKGA